MTVDMQMLVGVAVLSVLLAFPYTLALIAKVGLAGLVVILTQIL